MKYLFLIIFFISFIIGGCGRNDENEYGNAPKRIIDKTKEVSNAVSKKYENYDKIDSMVNRKGE